MILEAYIELARTYQLLNQPEQSVIKVERFLELKEKPNEHEQRIAKDILEWAYNILER
jgi:hypothetical protein